MEKNEQNTPPVEDKPLSAYAKYTSLGFQMIAIIGVFAFVGYKIDQNANHDPQWVTAVLALVGVFISLFLVIRSVKS
jgi:ATP synthase protein I